MSDAPAQTEAQTDPTKRPLVFDVDGTMIRSDLTHELFFEGAKAFPARIPWMIRQGLRSKSQLKDWIVSRVGQRLRPDILPLEPKAVLLAETAHAEGRPIYLCSGSEQSLVDRLGDTLPYVRESFGTTPDYNMTSENKAAFLQKRFPDGFDYVGNSTQDYAVWKVAQRGYAVRPPRDTVDRVSADGTPVTILEPRRFDLTTLYQSMRPDRWVRSLAILAGGLVPVGLGQEVNGWALALASFAFIALESAAYLFGDAASVQGDRADPVKRLRPMAAGTLSVTRGLGTALGLGVIVLAAIILLPWPAKALLLVQSLMLVLRKRRGPSFDRWLWIAPLLAGLSLAL